MIYCRICTFLLILILKNAKPSAKLSLNKKEMQLEIICSVTSLLMFLLVGCHEEKNTPQPFQAEQLANKNWYLVSDSIVIIGKIQDNYAGLATCVRDNITEFEQDGYYTVEEGNTTCKPTDRQIYKKGTWRLSGIQLRIIEEEAGIPVTEDYKIKNLSSNKLMLTQEMDVPDYTYTVTKTYIAL